MKFLSILILVVAAIAGRSTTANNGHKPYVTKTPRANVKPTIPANATNITAAI